MGARIKLPHTRALLRAALEGALDDIPTVGDPVFGLAVPTACPGVPGEVLNPRATWPDPAAYDARATDLAARFRQNFQQFEQVAAAVRDAGPRPG